MGMGAWGVMWLPTEATTRCAPGSPDLCCPKKGGGILQGPTGALLQFPWEQLDGRWECHVQGSLVVPRHREVSGGPLGAKLLWKPGFRGAPRPTALT